MTTETSRKRVVVIDSTPELRECVAALDNHTALDVQHWQDSVSKLDALLASSPDIIVLDATLESEKSLSLLQRISGMAVRVPVVVLSPVGSVATAVAAMRYGASEVVEASSEPEALQTAIEALVGAQLTDTLAQRKQRAEVQGDFGAMAGASLAMRELFNQVAQICQRDTTVLITGESGTGKELIAREIHRRSSRRDGPFVAINCAAIPETLIESELFGHERGAFTNAIEKRLGHVELANGGTLFLDEVGELSLAVQVKLLRFLQEQEFYRVGRSKPISVDVRVITATNRDLETAVREKTFRQDLLYRVNVVNLHVPPLRERREDIPRLINHCVKKLSPRYGGRIIGMSPEALSALCSYAWPGNVRELENVLEGLLALSDSDVVAVESLPRKVVGRSGDGAQAQLVDSSGLAFGEAERIFETEMIIKALHKANFVQTRAAKLLGISRRILKYKMDKLGISDQGEVGGYATSKRERSH
jgi:two-component system response regulator AtoC